MIWDATGNCLVAVAQGPMHIQSGGGGDCVPIEEVQHANAKLIASAPEMATEIARLRCEISGYAAQAKMRIEQIERRNAEIARLRADNERKDAEIANRDCLILTLQGECDNAQSAVDSLRAEAANKHEVAFMLIRFEHAAPKG